MTNQKPDMGKESGHKRQSRKAIRFTGILALLCLAILAGFAAFTWMRSATASNFLFNPLLPQITETESTNLAETSTAPSGSPSSASQETTQMPVTISPSLKPWDGASRVTILLIGLDYRDWGSGRDYSRSDTMILLTLDPLSRTAGILSIPRDMWVSIPGYQHGKINTAYYIGEAHKLPGGGPALAVKAVEQFLGVPINYYAQVNFGAFTRFIDEIGGVEIDVPEPITIDLLGAGSKTKKNLKPGIQVLPGEWALAYARARYTEGGDFDRARRQQQVIMSIRDRILSFELLPMLIQKAPSLYRELASGIRTNLELEQVIRLALLASEIPEENMQKGVLGKEYVIFGFSPDNLSILIPITDKIHLLRDQIFATSGVLSPQTPGDAQARMQAESARLALYNGTSSPNLDSRTADLLRSQGANVIEFSASEKAYAATTVIDHTGNPFTLKYLVEILNILPIKIYQRFDPNSNIDVEIYLGADWARSNGLP